MEEWRPVTVNSDYMVSNTGLIKSLKSGQKRFNVNLVQKTSHDGYMKIMLWANNKGKTYSVHRLVAMAFIPNTDNKPEVNHIDGDKKNNHVENLEWCTTGENLLHAYRSLSRKAPWTGVKGENSHVSKKVMQLEKCGTFIRFFCSTLEANKITGINDSHIPACCRNERKSAGGYKWQYATKEI